MEKETLFQKLGRRAWYEVRSRLNGITYLLTFRSYWHYLLNKAKPHQINTTCYFAARPNIYAGIGHQMANWIAGFWFARQFGLKFANIPFSTDKWDNFLGFGIGEMQYYDLLKDGYRVRRLPKFSENIPKELDLIKKIISAYAGSNTILLAQQDQFYFDQYGVIEDLQRKFLSAPFRQNDIIEYDPNRFNIAVHVRRTVIIESKVIEEDAAAKEKRWLSNDYYEKVLKQVLEIIEIKKPIAIWLFSTGKPEEFSDFEKYGEVRFCSQMDEYRSFAHLIFADLLITSKSSFSYKPALISKGIKVCPKNFWHGYPNSKDWILCENDGTFDVIKLKNILI